MAAVHEDSYTRTLWALGTISYSVHRELLMQRFRDGPPKGWDWVKNEERNLVQDPLLTKYDNYAKFFNFIWKDTDSVNTFLLQLNAEEQHSPDPLTPQPGPSGDEIRDDKWYDRRGILWVRTWVNRTKAHLEKCIADAPDLEIEEGKKILNLLIYNLSGRELEILREYLAAAQEKGWIRPSKSPVGAPILFVPKSDGTMRLEKSIRERQKVAKGQLNDVPMEKHWKPVAFWSKKFTGPSLRWHTYDKELSAIVESFKTWRHYLEHAPSTVWVLSDHNNLRYFMTTKELSPKQARWAEELARFDFEIEYKPGADNLADGLSRRPDYAQGLWVGEQKALQDAMLPTLQQKLRIWTIRTSMASSTTLEVQGSEPSDGGPERSRQLSEISALEQEFPDMLSDLGDESPILPRTQPTDKDCQCEEENYEARTEKFDVSKGLLGSLDSKYLSPNSLAREATQGEDAFALEPLDLLLQHIRRVQERDRAYYGNEALTRRAEGEANKTANMWEVDPTGILRRNGKVWIPEDAALRANLLIRNHDDPMGGHYGVDKTVAVLKMKYWWPHVKRDVSEYIRWCAACQLNKIRRHKP
ncbi:gag/polymerase/env polyprotein [Stemphylium lycopersici]|nr:gag/polymerase/env polyprotein [Stemphylium lycopersici]